MSWDFYVFFCNLSLYCLCSNLSPLVKFMDEVCLPGNWPITPLSPSLVAFCRWVICVGKKKEKTSRFSFCRQSPPPSWMQWMPFGTCSTSAYIATCPVDICGRQLSRQLLHIFITRNIMNEWEAREHNLFCPCCWNRVCIFSKNASGLHLQKGS